MKKFFYTALILGCIFLNSACFAQADMQGSAAVPASNEETLKVDQAKAKKEMKKKTEKKNKKHSKTPRKKTTAQDTKKETKE